MTSPKILAADAAAIIAAFLAYRTARDRAAATGCAAALAEQENALALLDDLRREAAHLTLDRDGPT